VSVQGIPAPSQLFNRLGDASLITGANTDLVQWSLMLSWEEVKLLFQKANIC